MSDAPNENPCPQCGRFHLPPCPMSNQQEPVKRYTVNRNLFDVHEVKPSGKVSVLKPPETVFVLFTDYDRDIKALRKRGRYWRHLTWLYRERLRCEETTTAEQAKTIARLQEENQKLHGWYNDAEQRAALKEARG